MKLGRQIFDIHISKIKVLLTQAQLEPNSAAWLFANDLRTPVFMLEASARIFERIYDDPKIEALKEEFKKLEDQCGSIDYYNAAAKNLSLNNLMPTRYISYFEQKSHQKTEEFNAILKNDGWLDFSKITEIESILDTIDWKKDIKGIKKVYEKAIEKNIEFIEELDFKFTNLEDHVHELRRKLRWLSIYPQALLGVFKFDDTAQQTPEYLVKYLTDSVINSPFNVLPTAVEPDENILLQKENYLALSWIIAELGKLKDRGLTIEILAEAIAETDKTTHNEAITLACTTLNEPQEIIEIIKSEAQAIAKVFFEEDNLHKILIS